MHCSAQMRFEKVFLTGDIFGRKALIEKLLKKAMAVAGNVSTMRSQPEPGIRFFSIVSFFCGRLPAVHLPGLFKNVKTQSGEQAGEGGIRRA